MKNPINKRLPREFKSDFKKYAVLFCLLVVTIGFVAGMFVANDSMEKELDEAYEKYNRQDGNFILKDEATDELVSAIEEKGIKLYKEFFKEFDETLRNESEPAAVIRVFASRNEVDKACVLSGALPVKDDEIAIDRMHADNNSISVGDVIRLDDKEFTVSGLVALSDYSTLHKNSTDMMFDSLTFNVGVVTQTAYDNLEKKQTYRYAFKYDETPAGDNEQKEVSDKLMEQVAVLAATGGMLDDKDAAKELSDNIDRWTDLIEEVQDKGEELEDRQKELEAEGKVLEEEGNALKEEAEALASEGAALKAEQGKLITLLAPALSAMGVTLNESTVQNNTMDMASIKKLVAYLPEAQQKMVNDFLNKAEELEKRGAELEEKGNELQERGDELNKKADELKADAEAFEPMIDEAKAAGDELKALEKYEDNINELTDFLPEYLNQAIHFAPDDMGSDKESGELLLIILVAVLAFIFAITASNTIVNESAVIGTLRASGYTKGELVRHYITLPIIITLFAAVIGNVLGYSVFKNVVVSMYYNSYSLPTYVTRWNANAFVKTTVYPVILVVAVNIFTVARKMRFSPLKFLRHDLSDSKKKRAMKLPQWKFFSRFRMRIFFQNIPGYLVLFLGIFLVNVLLSISIGLPSTLDNYQEHAPEYALVDYQYILKDTEDEDGNEIVTDEPTAERYSVSELETTDGVHVREPITVYGYEEGSRYFEISGALKDNEVYVTDGYAKKFSLSEGDEIVLKEKYADDEYTFKVAGTYEMPGTMGVIMPNEAFNKTFEKDEDSFSGYLSENEITDIDENMIAASVTIDDLLAIAKQLDHSMGDYMDYFSILCMLVAMLIIYLLTKLIIERSAGAISMVKVLGYENKEINSLYVRITTIVVMVSAVATLFLARQAVNLYWISFMNRMNGWFDLYMDVFAYLKMVLIICVAYAVVSLFDMRRIKRIPLTEALKTVE